MKEIKYVEKELTIQEIRNSLKSFENNPCDETFVKTSFDLLLSDVYIPVKAQLLLLTNKDGFLKDEYFENNVIFNDIFYFIDNKNRWLPIALDKEECKDCFPDESALIKIKYSQLCNEEVLNFGHIKGFIIDITGTNLWLQTEYIVEMSRLMKFMEGK